ncbi:MAG: DUF3021 family protein [Ruminococcus sp.]|jgi:hypothetical protein|nr:DUF3021 family protein [Ruminococcus sp.]
MKKLKWYFLAFCVINTFITLFVAAVLYIYFPGENITPDYLLKIPLLSFCSVIPAMILFSKKDPSRREFIIRRILHFVFTVAVVVVLLLLFGWLEIRQLPFFITFFLLVFCTTTYIGFRGEKKLAQKINEKIKNQK